MMSPASPMSPASSPRPRSGTARFAQLTLVVAAAVLLLLLGRRLGAYVPEFARWIESLGFWGPVAFVTGYVAATIAFVPGSLLTLAAGALFGLGKGTLLVFTGATLGAAAAFLVARYLARGAVAKRVEGSPRFAAVDRAVGREGLKMVFLLRLSPVFPFNLLNYALGLTRVRFLDYLVASVGMLPGTFLYVYIGKGIGSLAALAVGVKVDSGSGGWIVLAVGLLATILVTTLVTRAARRALTEVTDG